MNLSHIKNQAGIMQKLTSVLIVEDDESTRERFSRVISGHPQLELLGSAGDYVSACELLLKLNPDILLTDLDLPDGNGVDLIHEIKMRGLETEIMVISVFGDERHVVRAIEAGAGGYLLKDGEADQIANAIFQLMNGGAPISPAIAQHLLKRFRNTKEKPVEESSEHTMEALTKREQEILNFVSQGYTAHEIAEQINISHHTVNTHIRNIYSKLEVNSRAEAVMKGVQRGIIKSEQ
ncbi:MAG TPA: response regulator transcription factor [Thiotrichaceae bacterium]|jgi:DNA-binding NarL/FixJ family response regulator|nr:response regulator transcription factor [Thiotrichaceae bacterium]HIM07494.1 response regulator transcription factor [Gammaproteobacteria bacterium]